MTTDTTVICPRCEGFIPNNLNPGAYPGALSRWDNDTEVCSACGVEEALTALVANSHWPVTQWNDPLFVEAHLRRGQRLRVEGRFQ